jgi:hypothetical protein
MRGGPKLPQATGNIVPKTLTVQHVLKADPAKFKDRGWELAVQNVQPGTVVWHPGGGLTDHFSIHSFLNGLPLVLDATSPKVGDVLEATDPTLVPTFDPHAMLRGFIAGDLLNLNRLGYSGHGEVGPSAVIAMLIGLHNAAVMTGESAKWLGLSAALMLRLGSVAMRGEARHVGGHSESKVKPDRLSVYAKYRGKPLKYHRASLNRLVNIFRYGVWPSAGFGGPKWACCGATLAGLFNAVRDLAVSPTPDSAAKVVAALNLAVNQAHNGGWWLNKFADGSVFNDVPKGRPTVLVRSMRTFGVANKILRQLDKQPSVVAKKVAQYAAWRETKLTPPYTRSVTVSFHPGLGTLKMKLTTRLLKDGARTLNGKVTSGALNQTSDAGKALIAAMKTKTYLVEGEDGYRLEIKPDGGTPVVVWQEESLATLATKNSVKDSQ